MKTPLLLDVHKSLGARISEYAGWELPIDYGSTVREVTTVRTAAGLFDVSHMGRLDVVGNGAQIALQALLTNNISALTDDSGQYTLMCNEAGGVKDDLILYRRSGESYLLVVNAANLEKDKRWIADHLHDRADLVDCTHETAMFALQGPRAVEIAERVGISSAADIARFHFADRTISGMRVTVARTGYTGEDGFEIVCSAADAVLVWNALTAAGQDAGILPCGLAARDVLRIEAGLALYGHEIDETINPVEAGLMRFVRLDKADFIGRDAISAAQATGAHHRLVGIEMEGRTVPRAGDSVITSSGTGRVTSGTFSPTLSRGIAMAYVPAGTLNDGEVKVESHGGRKRGFVRRMPLYRRGRTIPSF